MPLQPSCTCCDSNHTQLSADDCGEASLAEIEALHELEVYFSAHSCKREKQPTQLQPRAFPKHSHADCTLWVHPPPPVPPFLLKQISRGHARSDITRQLRPISEDTKRPTLSQNASKSHTRRLQSMAWRPGNEARSMAWRPGNEVWRPGNEVWRPGNEAWRPGNEARST